MALKVKHLMTIDDLDALPYDELNKYELIEGELHVSPAPGIPHQLVLNNLLFELTNYLKQNLIGRLVPGPNAVFDTYNWVIPDIVYCSRERWNTIVAKHRFNAAPDLMIEIVSPGPTNRSRDLKLKQDVYSKFGVPEYWIVDTWSRSVIILRLADNVLEEVATLRENDVLESPIFPGLSVKLSNIFTDDEDAFLT